MIKWVDYSLRIRNFRKTLPYQYLMRFQHEGELLVAIRHTVGLECLCPSAPRIDATYTGHLGIDEEVGELGVRHLLRVSLFLIIAIVEVGDVVVER